MFRLFYNVRGGPDACPQPQPISGVHSLGTLNRLSLKLRRLKSLFAPPALAKQNPKQTSLLYSPHVVSAFFTCGYLFRVALFPRPIVDHTLLHNKHDA